MQGLYITSRYFLSYMRDKIIYMKNLLLAGGCFWCIEAALRQKKGVVNVTSGYATDSEKPATYDAVCSGEIVAREAVLVQYDTDMLSLEELLKHFFSVIDPIDALGQFADRGYSYTTAVYYTTAEEKACAEKVIEDLNASGIYTSPIATVIEPQAHFYTAESYHQEYAEKNPDHYKAYYVGSGRAAYMEK